MTRHAGSFAFAVHIRVQRQGIGIVVDAHDSVLRKIEFPVGLLNQHGIPGVSDDQAADDCAVGEDEAVRSAKRIVGREQQSA